ncbi:MAG: archease [Acidobacteriota bacterium]|nr:MAG: archease [Acidobacteriota bacterium]
MTGKYWEHFSHGADIGVRGIGSSLEEAFEQAAHAMTAVVTDPRLVAQQECLEIACQAPDDELLLVDWLNELVYAMSTRRMLFSRFDLAISNRHLSATVWGEQVDIPRHQPAVEIKGATYTSLKVARDDTGAWMAQCVVDV